MSPENPNRAYYPALDGLRGIAILLVVLFHNFGFINYFFFGWLGVDLFFVLSGFLITDILLKTRNSKNYLRNFYMRRILRIFPLYYLSLILLLIIIPRSGFSKIDFSYYINNQWWYWAYLQNWFLAMKDYGSHTTALHHFWSLAVEEQFYIIWPLIVLIATRTRWLILIMSALLVLVIGIRFSLWLHQIESFNYYGAFTFTRIDGLCIGSMLAILHFSHSAVLKNYSTFVLLGLALFNFIFYFFNQQNQFSFPYWATVGYTTFGVMFAILVYAVITRENKFINFLLELSVLRFFGRISYGFYIFHWPVYLVLYPHINTFTRHLVSLPEKTTGIVNAVILTLIGILISLLSYHTFEKYFLTLKKKFT